MDNRNKDNFDNEYEYDWDDQYYGTGNTEPPKERHGAMALMLILIIFLFGIITVLGILNIRLFQELKLKKKEAEGIVNAFLSTIEDALANGEKVQLVGFGTFETKERAARVGRNPATKETIEIPASKHPAFTAGKALKETVNK